MVWSFAFNNDGIGHAVNHVALDGDWCKIEYIDSIRERATVGVGFDPGVLYAGRPMKPDYVPTRVKRGEKKYGIPDVLHGINLLFANDRFKEIVERFEPRVHQFLLVEMLWEDGTLAQKMYMFNICNRLDTVGRERSAAQFGYPIWKPETGQIVFSLTRIGNHHVWIDKHVDSGKYTSDALHDALVDAGISGIKSSRREMTQAM